MFISDKKEFRTYPSGLEIIKEVSNHRRRFGYLELNSQRNKLIAYKLNEGLTYVRHYWNISFELSNETIIDYQQSHIENNIKWQDSFTISGKTLNKFEYSYEPIMILTQTNEKDTKRMYMVDSQSGLVYGFFPFKIPVKAATLQLLVYDNAAIIAVHYNKETKLQDQLILVEMCSSFIEDLSNYFGGVDSNLYTAIPIGTTLSVDWEIFGAQIIPKDGECIYCYSR